MNPKLVSLLFFTLLLLSSISLFSQGKKEIEKTFDAKEQLKIDLVLGDCLIKASGDDKIHVQLVYSYSDDYFEARFKEKSKSIIIQEKFHGQTGDGFSRWIISIPQNTEVELESATGDLNLEGVSGIFDGSSGTGSLEVIDSKGEFDLNSGTGSVTVENSVCEFDLNSGTGRVKVENCTG